MEQERRKYWIKEWRPEGRSVGIKGQEQRMNIRVIEENEEIEVKENADVGC